MNDEPATVDRDERPGRDQAVLRVQGEVDISNADSLGDRIVDLAGDASGVLLDLTALGFLDSKGLRMLHGLSDRFRDGGVGFTVLAPRNTVAGETIRLAVMDEHLDVRDTPDP